MTELKFFEEEVSFSIKDISLSGTLTIPEKVGISPVVILLSGYGSSTRDFDEGGIKKFKIIADFLVKHGIASLRYDDRGAGKSSPVNWSDYTFDDLAEEVQAAIEFLENDKRIDSKNIGLLGHSLGAAIAPMTASRTDKVSFIVLMGAHGLKGKETGQITRKCVGKLLGESEEEIAKYSRFIKKCYDVILSEGDWEKMNKEILVVLNERFEKLPKEYQNMFKTSENYTKSTYEGFLLKGGFTPMFRSFLNHDPSKVFSKVQCPLLLLFADEDIFHPQKEHSKAIIDALKEGGNNKFTIKVFQKTSHEFSTAESRKKNTFNPELLPTIGEWLKYLLL